jgi:hypothetical protein
MQADFGFGPRAPGPSVKEAGSGAAGFRPQRRRPILQSPKEMPMSRAVRMVSQSSGTVFMRRMLASSGT